MSEELKEILDTIKDKTRDYVGTNGCLYQDLTREELDLLLNHIEQLQWELKQRDEVIDEIIKFANKYQNSSAIPNIILFKIGELQEFLNKYKGDNK